MFTWTETPLSEMWHHLRYLRSPSNVYELLSGKIKSKREEKWPESEELKQRSYEIAACIRQADEYYSASETVGLVTEPLLQFYGIQALAKAVILSNNSNTWLSDLNYHGLNTRASKATPEDAEQLGAYSTDSSLWSLEKEFAVTNGGVFRELCRAIEDTVPDKGQVLRLKELLRVIPDLATIYYRHYGEPSHCFYIYGRYQMIPGIKMEVKFSRKQNEHLESIREVFPEFNSGFEEISPEDKISGFRSLEGIKELPKFCAIEKGTVAGEYLIRPLSCGFYKSFSVLYASMFILSIVVRYKPAFWMRVVEGEQSGSASIAAALCNIAKRRLPNDALEQIWQEDFTYATPGYLT